MWVCYGGLLIGIWRNFMFFCKKKIKKKKKTICLFFYIFDISDWWINVMLKNPQKFHIIIIIFIHLCQCFCLFFYIFDICLVDQRYAEKPTKVSYNNHNFHSFISMFLFVFLHIRYICLVDQRMLKNPQKFHIIIIIFNGKNHSLL